VKGYDVKREDVKREGRRNADVSLTSSRLHISRFRPAFTLLEMIATLALLAILAAVVTVSLAGPRRAARAQDAADEVLNYDRLAREWCRRFGRPGGITFDLDRGAVRRVMAGQSDGAPQPATLHVSGGFRIARLVSAGQSQEAGEVTLPCSPRGQTPSYAVLLAGPEGRQQWVVVAGLSGKAVTANNAREVEAIFESLSGGDDAP
jgi:prepilin-type N-terminal cleavage/methylation domain-containing protein